MPLSLALSTHWNAARHTDGGAMVDEILALGFEAVEAGYDLRLDLAEGLRQRVEEGAVRVGSVHNYCPVPVGAPRGNPELFLMADPREAGRLSAVRHTTETIRFAAGIGARVVVAHAGRIEMRPRSRELMDLCEAGRQYSPAYERLHTKLLMRRDRKAPPYLDSLYRSLDELLPVLEECGICLALENLPSWETLPSEPEMKAITARYDTPLIKFWFDVGHGQIRQVLGFSSPHHWLAKLGARVAGMHLHDVVPPVTDHVMPPHGSIDFGALKPLVRPDMVLTLEPAPGTPPERVTEGRRTLDEVLAPDAAGRAGKTGETA